MAVFPSLYEPFGIVVLEAMAAAVPIVTSDIGGFREVVRHNETGIQTWANNPHSLAWGISRVLSDAALAKRLRRAGGEVVRRQFGWGGIAKQTMSVYGEVLGELKQGIAPRVAWTMGPGVRPRYLGLKEPVERS